MEAGGGILRTLRAAESETRQSLRVLHTTQEYTPHAVAVSPTLPSSTANKIRTVLTSMTDQTILNPLKVNGFVAADNQDWDDVRALNLQVIRP